MNYEQGMTFYLIICRKVKVKTIRRDKIKLCVS